MAYGKGVDALFGMIKGTTWGTSVAVGAASMGFRAKSWEYDEQIEPLQDKGYNASALWRQTTNVGNYTVSGSFTVDLKYEGFQLPQAAFFGTAGVPTGSNPYVHTWSVKNDMSGVFVCLAWYDGIKTHEIDSAKITGISYKIKPGMPVEMTVKWRGRRRQENTGTNANLNSLTEISTIDRVQSLASLLTFQTITQNGTLAAFEVSEASFDFERKYEDGARCVTSTSAPYIREPAAGDFDTKVSVSIPHEATTYMLGALAGTTYEIKCLHTLSASAAHGIFLPSVTWEKASVSMADKAGMVQKLDGRSDKAVTAPTDFNSLTVPHILATNTISTNALA